MQEVGERYVDAWTAPEVSRGHPFWRQKSAIVGLLMLVGTFLACVCSLPWTLGEVSQNGKSAVARYDDGEARNGRLPPFWWKPTPDQRLQLNHAVEEADVLIVAKEQRVNIEAARNAIEGDAAKAMEKKWPQYVLGTDVLGRSLFVRVLTGGGISLGIGLAAAIISVFIGTLYGAMAGYIGGRVDGVLMRIVDVLYGLPYVLLVVLMAVAADAGMERMMMGRVKTAVGQQQAYFQAEIEKFPVERRRDIQLKKQIEEDAKQKFRVDEVGGGSRTMLNVLTLLVAIGGVSWLTMARVIRGQVLSLKNQPFIEAARAMGLSPLRVFFRHLLPNLVGPIVVYATLTVPQAILQESFLSFLGIGVKPPLPSWGNLAAEGLGELNPYQSHWWLLVFPCVLLAMTLLAMNLVGEGLREALDPKSRRR